MYQNIRHPISMVPNARGNGSFAYSALSDTVSSAAVNMSIHGVISAGLLPISPAWLYSTHGWPERLNSIAAEARSKPQRRSGFGRIASRDRYESLMRIDPELAAHFPIREHATRLEGVRAETFVHLHQKRQAASTEFSLREEIHEQMLESGISNSNQTEASLVTTGVAVDLYLELYREFTKLDLTGVVQLYRKIERSLISPMADYQTYQQQERYHSRKRLPLTLAHANQLINDCSLDFTQRTRDLLDANEVLVARIEHTSLTSGVDYDADKARLKGAIADHAKACVRMVLALEDAYLRLDLDPVMGKSFEDRAKELYAPARKAPVVPRAAA